MEDAKVHSDKAGCCKASKCVRQVSDGVKFENERCFRPRFIDKKGGPRLLLVHPPAVETHYGRNGKEDEWRVRRTLAAEMHRIII